MPYAIKKESDEVRALLDVHVLIALLDADHLHHAHATAWLEKNIDAGWGSCPITQNGCIRIMSQPAYPNPIPAALVAERLAAAVAQPFHTFWPDTISMLDQKVIDWSRVLNSRQVTDSYLLALALQNKGSLVIFDQGISIATVRGATAANLSVLPPSTT